MQRASQISYGIVRKATRFFFNYLPNNHKMQKRLGFYEVPLKSRDGYERFSNDLCRNFEISNPRKEKESVPAKNKFLGQYPPICLCLGDGPLPSNNRVLHLYAKLLMPMVLVLVLVLQVKRLPKRPTAYFTLVNCDYLFNHST